MRDGAAGRTARHRRRALAGASRALALLLADAHPAGDPGDRHVGWGRQLIPRNALPDRARRAPRRAPRAPPRAPLAPSERTRWPVRRRAAARASPRATPP